MKSAKQYAKHVTKALGLVALAAAVVATAAPADATPVPPTASAALNGTWVNTNTATRSIKQIVITPSRTGTVGVDAFGSCSPSLCEWGRVPATVYGASVSATTGMTFQTQQRFLSGRSEWSRTVLFGKVAKTAKGLRLTVRKMTAFEDGSGRHNYQSVETFARGKGVAATKAGNPASGYVMGAPPAVDSGLLGSWTNPTPAGSLVGLKITGTTSHPIVQAAGQCSPTPCNWGMSKAIAYGASISATTTSTVLAPYSFGFKNAQLVITMRHTPTGDRLTINEYNEFTDGSGRSNYTTTETFVRV